MNYLKEHKKAVIIFIVCIILYTTHAVYLNASNNELKVQLVKAQELSYEETQKRVIDNLYETRDYLILDTEKMLTQIETNNSDKIITESLIRCEKENMFSENKVNCSENWENYSKK